MSLHTYKLTSRGLIAGATPEGGDMVGEVVLRNSEDNYEEMSD